MRYEHTPTPSRWIVLLLAALACPPANLATSSEPEQALAAIDDCLAASPPAWPQGWQSEYVNAIRDALRGHEAPADYTLRLDALREGFPLYWQDVTTNGDRPLFELQCAEIKWYARHLVSSPLPAEDDRHAIRKQMKDLWHTAADSLIAQFPFPDPNMVCKARADHLHDCLRWVDAPLKPIFRQPFAAEQINRIREGWHELRYARVDLMRQLGGEDVFLALRPREAAPSDHPHYLLTYRSLEQLESFIWTVVTRPPEDYLKAQQNYWKARHSLPGPRSSGSQQSARGISLRPNT